MVRLGINIVCISIWTVFALSGQRTISEKFDLGIPQDWNQSSNAEDGGWLHGNAEVLRSEYWPINDPPDGTLFIATNDDKCDCDKSEDYLILPKMDFRENTDLIYMDLEYSFRGQTWTDGDGNSFTEHLYLKLSYDGGNSWEEFEELPGDQTDNWRNYRIDLTDLRGQENVLLAIHYFDDNGWTWGAAINSLELIQTFRLDASINLPDGFHEFYGVDQDFNLFAEFTNLGTQSINQLVFELISPNATQEFTLEYNLDFEESITLQFQNPISLSSPDPIDFNFKIKSINGITDLNPATENNYFTLYGVKDPPNKKVFIENIAGNWCSACPLAYVWADYINNNLSELSTVSNIHMSNPEMTDPLEISEYNEPIRYLTYNAPLTIIDRRVATFIPNPLDFIDLQIQYIQGFSNQASPIGLDIVASNNGIDRVVNFDIELSFHSNIAEKNVNFLFLVNRNNVSALEENLIQYNEFSGSDIQGMEYWSDLEEITDDFTLNDVLHNSLFAGFTGVTDLIPSEFVAGNVFKFGASFTIPEDQEFADYDFNIVVTDPNTNAVINANRVDQLEIISQTDNLDENNSHHFIFQQANELVIDLNSIPNAHYIDLYATNGSNIFSYNIYQIDSQLINFDMTDKPSGCYLAIIRERDTNRMFKQLVFYTR